MREKYQDLTDEELLSRYRDGEKNIMDYIMDKYKNLVRSKAGTMFILGGDREDLIQEGMIALFQAIRDYDSGRDASFLTFADLCVTRKMYSAVRASGRKKHAPLNSYISLYSSQKESDEDIPLVSILPDDGVSNPEEAWIDKENLANLETKIDQELSSFEKEVLDLYLTGLSYTQIARVLDRDDKATDNALHRLKNKIRKML
ncbi:MAG: RNA polymerase sporulation sigma factor SigH [Lachnospiraceae bacterium]|nr:RNA polymerase sporulation sigma factor SigH [Lachnospiraceae bacterium]